MADPLTSFISEAALDTGNYANTTGATQLVAARFTTAPDHAYVARAKIIATETADHDEVAYYERVALFKNDGGTLSLVGSIAAPVTIESTAGWDVTLDAATEDNNGDTSSTDKNIRVLVTGAASTVVTWNVKLEIISLAGYIANYGPTG